MKPRPWALGAVSTCLVLGAAAAAQAQTASFASAGSRATLTVEYRYEAQGRKQDKLDLHEWKLRRGVDLAVELEAKPPSPLPMLQPLDAAQSGKLQQQQAQMQRAATQMAPMMAGAQAIMDKCGDDEKCMEREAMKMGAAMAGTQQLDDTLRTGRETAAVMKPGADRYQRWEGRSQQGSYTLDESWHAVHADPICMRLPKARCTHDLARKGSGTLAASKTPAVVEFDLQGNALVLMLPVPLVPLAYTETHTTDEPEGTHSSPTPRGPQSGQTMLRVTPDEKITPAPLKVALKGGWRSQAGEQVVAVPIEAWHGGPAEKGRLVVRWRFSVK